VQSALPGAVWPAVPGGDGAATFALLQQFEDTQWLAGEQLAALQLRQLDVLLRHAYDTVPFYRKRWNGSYDPAATLSLERFSRLPRLTRAALQTRFEALKSEHIPAGHGRVFPVATTGSTGTPVQVLKTALVALLWNAFTLRDHLWHGRDLRGKLAVIRGRIEPFEAQSWGPATFGLLETGPAVMLGVGADVETQLAWLLEQRPDYLLTYATNAAELAKASLARGVRLPGLREVRLFAELLDPEVRDLCRRAWGAKVTDTYSASEVGYIALQCPEHDHYHVQSEGVLVEVLDDEGRPCASGEVGRVVVTVLHNFATPLVRYDIGDFAEPGGPCPCGRGLPVLRRIVGRTRNALVTADGKRYWPSWGSRALLEIAALRQYQLVQTEYGLVELRVVADGPLSADQQDRLRRHLLASLPPGMRLQLRHVDAIGRGAGGKFEEFVCEVPAP